MNRSTPRGFTLVEVALVIAIGGIVLASFASALQVYARQSQAKLNQQKISSIRAAIDQFQADNGRYPCPALSTAAPDTPQFGREVADCANTAVPSQVGFESVPGRDGRPVRIGTIPVRDLDLPDDITIDAYGQRYTYAVTELLTTPAFNSVEGGIFVVDSNGNSVITPAGSAHYVIVSHGRDNLGAYTPQGILGPACPPIGARLDARNCSRTATYVRTDIRSTSQTATHYDDTVSVRSAAPPSQVIPVGAIMAFDLDACPNGWAEVADARGRFIIGAGGYSQIYSAPDRAPWTFTANYARGSMGGFSTWRMTDQEVPQHSHALSPINVRQLASGGSLVSVVSPSSALGGSGVTALTGSNIPIENRPPFLAFLICRRL